jgi:Protein of unknown function (DUF1203)
MQYRIRGLSPENFENVLGRPYEQLNAWGAERHHVTTKPGAPCRISLEDAEIGETVILLSYEHQPATTPYRQAGPIFVRECPVAVYDALDAIPPALAVRVLSLRAFDDSGTMIDADVIEGASLQEAANRLLANPRVSEVHVHYAKRGCFAARITRA